MLPVTFVDNFLLFGRFYILFPKHRKIVLFYKKLDCTSTTYDVIFRYPSDQSRQTSPKLTKAWKLKKLKKKAVAKEMYFWKLQRNLASEGHPLISHVQCWLLTQFFRKISDQTSNMTDISLTLTRSDLHTMAVDGYVTKSNVTLCHITIIAEWKK